MDAVLKLLYCSGKLVELSVEDLKGILNDEDHFEKFIMELETEYEPLGN